MPSLLINLSTRSVRYDGETVDYASLPARQVAIVFGAGVYVDGTPTPYLQNRIATAVNLYHADKVEHILMSGDNSIEHYNEPTVMRDVAISMGVPPEHVTIDYAGLSTYDTCYRAKHIFDVDEAIVVTQGYHVPRAVYTCKGVGVDAYGIAAVRDSRDFTISYLLRELVATNKAVLEVAFKPQPTILGNPEPIF